MVVGVASMKDEPLPRTRWGSLVHWALDVYSRQPQAQVQQELLMAEVLEH